MKIGVISDTHIPERAPKIPPELFTIFKDVDLIIHAGDLACLDALEQLKKIAPVKAVCGNMDTHEVQCTLPKKEILTIGKFKIGIFHGKGAPGRITSCAKEAFGEKLDVVIFGHSHSPVCEKHGGTLFFNPGSPTDTMFAPYRSCGILEINDEIKATIVRLS